MNCYNIRSTSSAKTAIAFVVLVGLTTFLLPIPKDSEAIVSGGITTPAYIFTIYVLTQLVSSSFYQITILEDSMRICKRTILDPRNTKYKRINFREICEYTFVPGRSYSVLTLLLPDYQSISFSKQRFLVWDDFSSFVRKFASVYAHNKRLSVNDTHADMRIDFNIGGSIFPLLLLYVALAYFATAMFIIFYLLLSGSLWVTGSWACFSLLIMMIPLIGLFTISKLEKKPIKFF